MNKQKGYFVFEIMPIIGIIVTIAVVAGFVWMIAHSASITNARKQECQIKGGIMTTINDDNVCIRTDAIIPLESPRW